MIPALIFCSRALWLGKSTPPPSRWLSVVIFPALPWSADQAPQSNWPYIVEFSDFAASGALEICWAAAAVISCVFGWRCSQANFQGGVHPVGFLSVIVIAQMLANRRTFILGTWIREQTSCRIMIILSGLWTQQFECKVNTKKTTTN